MEEVSAAIRVFLSYSRADEGAAVRLAGALEATGDVEIFRDKDDILPAEEWRARLEGLLRAADAVVVCLSPASVASREVLWEVETAERLSKRILPVVLRPFTEQAPTSVARLNYLDMTDPAAWEDGIAKLRSAIHTDIAWVREHTRIGELAARWTAGGQRAADLLRGPALEAAEAWLAAQPRHASPPTAEQRDFIVTARRGATRRQRQWVAGSLAVAAGAIGLSLLAYWQRGIAVAQRTEATARRLSAEAQLALSDPLAAGERPVRDLLVSLALAPSDAAQEALAFGVRRLPPSSLGELPWPEDSHGPRLLRFSQDGRWLGAVTAKEALFWDVPARRLVLRHALPEDDRHPRLDFASGSARALVTLRAPAAPEKPGLWVAVDLEAARAEELGPDEALDAMVAGAAVLALCRAEAEPVIPSVPPGRARREEQPDPARHPLGGPRAAAPGRTPPAGAQSAGQRETPPSITGAAAPGPCEHRAAAQGMVAVLDLTSHVMTALPAPPDRFGLVAFGRLFLRPAAAVSPMMAMSPVPPGAASPTTPMAVLADGRGMAFITRIEPGSRPEPLHLPEGAEPLDVDGRQGLLAIRHPQSGDGVLRLPQGEAVWQASTRDVRFHGFAEGGRFIAVEDATGPRLQSLSENLQLRIESARHTDWDLGAIGDIGRYTPIVAVETAEASGRIATAWKDGRITLWRAGVAPRYGAWGAMPMPNFEAVARFDHGQELGAVPGTWLELPSLFVSPSGRHLASQGFGDSIGAIGRITRIDPLFRIWDTNRQEEVARLRTGAPMIAAFSPDDRLMVTVEAAASARPAALRLRLWNLRQKGPATEETRETVAIPLTGAVPVPEPISGQSGTVQLRPGIWSPLGAGPLWVGADLGLRYRDPRGGVVVLEDLRPVITATMARMFGPDGSDGQGERDDTLPQANRKRRTDEAVESLEQQIAGHPPELPFAGFVAAVSGDGRRAILALGSLVRLYALDGSPRLLRVFDLSPYTAAPMVQALVLSRDGASFAAVVVPPSTRLADGSEAARKAGLQTTLLVFRADSDAVVHERTTSAIPTPADLRPGERPLAISSNGQLLAVDATGITSSGDGPASMSARVSVLDLERGEEILALSPRTLAPNPLGSWEVDGGDEPMAAFDPSGSRVVVMRDAPDCPMVTEMTPSLLPVRVPGCLERRVSFSLWDLPGRRRIAETVLVREADPAARLADPSTVYTRAMQRMTGLPLAPVPPMRLDLPEPMRATLSATEVRVAGEGTPSRLEIAELRHRVTLGPDVTGMAAACARLPSDMARLDPAAWATLLPEESYRAICPETAMGSPER